MAWEKESAKSGPPERLEDTPYARAQKNAIMLEYRNEPHHPRKYFNRLDYAIRMKEFYNTYLKHQPAPEWIQKGIEFRGK